jgi:hypothetical protein
LNAISLNVTQFDVPVETKFNGSASTNSNRRADQRNRTRLEQKRDQNAETAEPSTRSVPISFVRRATAAYIVFIPQSPLRPP